MKKKLNELFRRKRLHELTKRRMKRVHEGSDCQNLTSLARNIQLKGELQNMWQAPKLVTSKSITIQDLLSQILVHYRLLSF